MRRAKIGDVYAVPLRNGYKIIQWAYLVPKRGHYIRVFPEIYQSIPNDIQDIVKGPHSYILGFYVPRAYRIGLIQFIDNVPVPEEYPLPEIMLRPLVDDDGKLYGIQYTNFSNFYDLKTVYTRKASRVPRKYRGYNFINSYPPPAWLFYFFEYGYDMDHLYLEFPGLIPGGCECMDYYQKIVDEAMEKDRQQRAQAKALKNKK